jgi:hypothetical protein
MRCQPWAAGDRNRQSPLFARSRAGAVPRLTERGSASFGSAPPSAGRHYYRPPGRSGFRLSLFKSYSDRHLMLISNSGSVTNR